MARRGGSTFAKRARGAGGTSGGLGKWAAGHIRGAEYMGRGVLERDIEERVPDKNGELILYCGGGFRSALSADNLQKMGYTNVASMAGGGGGWKQGGGPVEG